jgi:hypothetical protein
MLGAIIPIPPELRARRKPADPQALRIQANRDRSVGLDALVTKFLPELRKASANLRSERGRPLAQTLRETFAGLDRLRMESRDSLPTQAARDWFERLSDNAIVVESDAMNTHASRESRTWRALVSEDALKYRIAEAEHHPEDEARCAKAFEDGIAAAAGCAASRRTARRPTGQRPAAAGRHAAARRPAGQCTAAQPQADRERGPRHPEGADCRSHPIRCGFDGGARQGCASCRSARHRRRSPPQ